tara:strand:+ start:2166 stop:2612 length:447 start_codon:yes stop_codon:yes gene_type:complete
LNFQFNGYFYKNEKIAFEDVRKVFLTKFSISENFILHIHSVSDYHSKELNKYYFKKNYPTDVLTIPIYNDLASINKLNKNNSEILGDLFLNRKLIKDHSKKFKKTLIEEYQLVLVHGLLHLIGYSHDDSKKLSNIENTILKKVWNEEK